MIQSPPIVDPKQKAQELFEIARINKVAYIDDKFNTEAYRSDFVGTLIEMFKSHQNIEKIDFIDWQKPQPIFEKNIEEIWDHTDDSTRNIYLKKLYEIRGDKEEWSNLNGVIEVSKHLADYLVTFSPKEWETKRDEFLEENTKEQSRVLCLFDKELNLDAGRDGITLLSDVLNGDYADKIYCGIFSQHVSIGEEFEQKQEWVSTYTLTDRISEKFYPISKETIQTESVLGFIDGIKNVLIVEEVEKLKIQSKEILLEAQGKAIKGLDDLSPETYNQIVQRSSRIEGTWEINTLLRISNIFQDLAFQESITSAEIRGKFNKSISSVRKYDSVEIHNSPERWGIQTNWLRDKEVFEGGEIINALHQPLTNGDIFKLGTKEYMLLGQPCNLSLRNGNRSNNFELATLVQILAKEPNAYFEKIPSINKWLRFSSHYSIKLDILDLAVFNTDGLCKIKLDGGLEAEILYQDSLKMRYSKLCKIHSKCAMRIIELQKILKNSENGKKFYSLLKPIITLDSSFKGLPQNPYNPEQNEFNFGIQRVNKLKEPYASHMLQQFMLYLSRNAFEHDFSK